LLCSVKLLAYLVFASRTYAQPVNGTTNGESSIVIEAAGEVDCATTGNTNWHAAPVGTALLPGDRLRTHDQSRAAVQLSDRSVIRLDERTTLEILPPRHTEKKRFGLPNGSVFFFNREKPADVEFDTPLAAGAIRGTEFLLQSFETSPGMRLALIDGLVSLQTSNGEIDLKRGDDFSLTAGQPPQITPLINATGAIQWALYYPAVIDPDDLGLNREDANNLAVVIEHYRAGDVLAALHSWPAGSATMSPSRQVLHAAVELSVGNVATAESLLALLPIDSPGSPALRELIATVKGETNRANTVPQNASEWLARSYSLQAISDLPAARDAAWQATERAPRFGFARARLAELEFYFGNRRAALAELDAAMNLSPRLAPAYALRGFVLLQAGDTSAALTAFDRARSLDAAFGPAWLGRGLCQMRQRDFTGARTSFQAAAALEPRRAVFRVYLGKSAAELGDDKAAEKEFDLAKRLDPNDPTGWFYSALQLWQENRINESIRNLQESIDLNDQRAPFRSRLLLDEDRSVRSANLAAIYDDAGIPDVSLHTAARSVAEDYANFSGHLFLSDSYQALLAGNRFDLRLETARESELLVANLLAPPGAGNLSQQLSQQEHLQFFDPRPIAGSSLTAYDSRGNLLLAETLFGTIDRFSYALDASYDTINGQRPNNQSLEHDYTLTVKQQVTADDQLYLQIGENTTSSGDVATLYDPAQAIIGFHAHEQQQPNLFAGWHHTWSPGDHTLFLFSRLDDQLTYTNPEPNVVFLFQSGGVVSAIQAPPLGPPFHLNFDRDFTLYSAELQQIWETPRQSLVVGGRWQHGDVTTHAVLDRSFPGVITDQTQSGTLDRGDVYGYYSWRPIDSLQLIGGASYDSVRFPENTDIPPISNRESSRNLASPKAGLLFTPWRGGQLRGVYTKSLGGLFFDNSVRLEPSQVAGFNQAFRSLIPESVESLVPGTEFETAGVGFDQSLKKGTFFGLEADWLTSEGHRTVGVLTNQFFFPSPDSPSGTEQNLDFRERDLSAYLGQLLGNYFSLGARYRISEAHLVGSFPQIPNTAAGLNQIVQDNHATLQQTSLAATFNHPTGFFAQWVSSWYHQDNSGYTPALANADFWQHNAFVGYRFPRRYAEVQLGVLNIFDRDYRLNPLNLYSELPRGRTFTASLRVNF
jgi:lipoprotein NlpI